MSVLQKHQWKLFIAVTAAGFFLDWFTKHLAVSHLNMGRQVPVLGSLLQWQLIYNTGGIFGFNPKQWFPAFPTNLVYYVMSIIAIVCILLYYAKNKPKTVLSFWGVSLILPGAMGNLFDRIIRPGQGVVDFIRVDLGFPPFNPWPIWNLADAYLTVGVILVIIDLWLQERTRGAPAPDKTSRP